MSVNLDKNQRDLVSSWKEVVNEKSDTSWAVYGYENQSDILEYNSNNNSGLGTLHLNGTNTNIPEAPSSINQTLPTPPSDSSSPISYHSRDSPTIINNGASSGHKRDLTGYFFDNGSMHSNNNNNNNNTLNESEPSPKKVHTNGKKTKGRVKIKMEFIPNKLRRYTTFSKRKSGIMKKAYELSTLTGTQVMLLVASETGHVYTFATKKLKPMITSDTGKALIKTCLFSPEPQTNGYDPRMSSSGYEETELSYSVNDDSSEKDEDSSSSQDIFSSSGAIGMASSSANDGNNKHNNNAGGASTASTASTASASSTSLSSISAKTSIYHNNHTSNINSQQQLQLQQSSSSVALALTSTAATSTTPSSSSSSSSSASSPCPSTNNTKHGGSASPSPSSLSSIGSTIPISFNIPAICSRSSTTTAQSSTTNLSSSSVTFIETSLSTSSPSSSSSSLSSTSSSSSLSSSSSTSSLPLKLTTTNPANRSIGLTNNHNNNDNTGTTFTAAILGGILPSSALLNGVPNYQESLGSSGTINPASLYKLPDFASSVTDSRLSSKMSPSLFNTGNVVLCTNQSQSNNGLMYHTPQGVVYATNSNTIFPESLILNLGQNLSQASAISNSISERNNSHNQVNVSESIGRHRSQNEMISHHDAHHNNHSHNIKSLKNGTHKKSRKL